MPRPGEKDGVVEYLSEMDDDEDIEPLADESGETPSVPAEEVEQEDASIEEDAPEGRGRDLTTLPEFRKYQADRDREIAELRSRLDRTEQTQQEADLQQIAAEVEQLYAAAEDAEDPNERRRLLKEAGQREGYIQFQQWQRWEGYKRQVAKAHGVDPDDKRFQKQYTSAEEFERDVLKVETETLRKKLAALEGDTSPETQRRKVARSAQVSGSNFVDTGEPRGGGGEGALARDIELLNSGRMKPEKFAAKWGGK